jgi:SCY1-like protein 2
MLSVASSLFGKSSTLGAYTLHSAAPSPSSSSTHLPASGRSSPSRTRSFNVGLWKVVGATHKTTGKDVSVWVFEKRVLDGVRGGREWVLEQLKKEAQALSRLRHPDVLHMVEPLEETRAELTFVTETISGSLGNALAAAKKNGEVDLDEVEIQKGTLQIARALGFLHTQAKSVHLNLSPDAILVNAKVSAAGSSCHWHDRAELEPRRWADHRATGSSPASTSCCRCSSPMAAPQNTSTPRSTRACPHRCSGSSTISVSYKLCA